MDPIKEEHNPIIGWRKLIFGITSVLGACVIEAFVTGGWSKAGISGLVALNALFYGPPVLKEFKGIVQAWKGRP